MFGIMKFDNNFKGENERYHIIYKDDEYVWQKLRWFHFDNIEYMDSDHPYMFDNIEDAIKLYDSLYICKSENCFIAEFNPFSNYKYTLSTNGDECWYDDNGFMTHYKRTDGYEVYFDNGHATYIRNNNIEEWREYEDDTLTHIKRSDGFEEWYGWDDDNLWYFTKRNINGEIKLVRTNKYNVITDYDENENPIYRIDEDDGTQEWWEYNENGKEKYYKIIDEDRDEYRYYEYNDDCLIVCEKIVNNINDSIRKVHYEYNENGDYIHIVEIEEDNIFFKYDSIISEEWREYNDAGQLIHKKVVDVESEFDNYDLYFEYQLDRHILHTVFHNGGEEWELFNNNGQRICKRTYTRTDKGEEWCEYDKKLKLIKRHTKDLDGFEEWFEYHDKYSRDIITHYKNSNGEKRRCKYDKYGNPTYFKDSDGSEKWMKWDDRNNCIYIKDQTGLENWYKHDRYGNDIYHKDSTGFEEWCEYDSYGNILSYRNSHGDYEDYRHGDYVRNNDLTDAIEKRLRLW